MKKLIWMAIFVPLVFCLISSAEAAQQEKEGLKAKLSDLRNKKHEMTSEYKLNLDKINRKTEDKIAVLKTNFRKAREECLAEKHENSEQLRKDFESKLRPILKEEEELVQMVGRDAREDFARSKAKKAK